MKPAELRKGETALRARAVPRGERYARLDPAARRGVEESVRARALGLIRTSPLFERASRATREAVVESAIVSTAAAGSTLVTQGTRAVALIVLGRGRARVERVVVQGRVVPLGYRSSGDLLGEACLVDESAAHAENIVAMEDVEIATIAAPTARQLFAADPVLAAGMLRVAFERRREAEDRVESLLFRNVEGRLAEFLLAAATRWGVPVPGGTLISAPITHLEIAQTIGSTRETVTLTIGALRREGVLGVAGRRLIVKDKPRLLERMTDPANRLSVECAIQSPTK